MNKKIIKTNIIIIAIVILILMGCFAIRTLSSSFTAANCPYNIKFTQVAYGGDSKAETVLAIDTDGHLWTWGRDWTSYMSASPISTVPLQVTNNNRFKQVSGSYALDVNGNVWEISKTTLTQRSSGISFKKISANNSAEDNYCLAIDNSNNLYSYGTNNNGQLGNGNTTDKNGGRQANHTSFIKVKTGIKDVSAAGTHALAIDTSNNLYAWGSCVLGEIGNGSQTGNDVQNLYDITGSTITYSTPTQSIPLKIKSGISKISASNHISFAIDTSGNLWSWGWQKNGSLGNGGASNATNGSNLVQTTPLKIASNMAEVAAGDRGALAIDKNGNLWAWGYNYKGELGIGNNTQQSTPVKVNTENTVTQIAMSNGNSMYIDSEGDLWTVGSNYYGQLGNGKTSAANEWTGEFIQITANPTYKITLNTNGGTINSGEVSSYKLGEGAILPTNVTKTGYTFEGWYTNSNFSGSRVTSIGITETGDKTYYAKWTANTYTVTLNKNGGTINSGNITSYTYGRGATLPTNVTKTGYTFGGWYTNSNFSGSRVTSIGATETGNKTYYAKWTANTYTVTLNKNGGTINSGDVTSYTYGIGVTLPTSVTKEGHTFGGWYNNSSCTGIAVTSISSTETGNKTYWAKWDIIGYTVTFKDADKVVKTQEVSHGGAATAPVLTKEGYVLRWDKEYTNITSDITVNAIWLKDTDKDGIPDIEDPETLVNYKVEHYKQNVTLNGYENPEIETKQGNLGTTANASQKTYEGFTLVTTTETITSGIVTDDGSLTLKLYYNRNKYTVTLNSNGGTINDQNYITEYVYGIGVTLPTNVTKEGYTFGGWYDNAELTGSAISQITANDLNNKTYWAKWNIIGHTVIFKDGDKVVKTQEVNHGEAATAPVLTKEGYVLRWDKEYTNITSDITVNAIWLKDTDKDGIPDIEDPETLVNYKVEHYKQNVTLNGYENPEIETKQGNLGTTANASQKTYEGFTLVTTTETITSGIVTDDGSLTLKLYYNRNKYTVTLNSNGGTINDQNYITEYVYGIGVTLPTNVTKEGYTFGGWYDNAELTGSAISQITANDLNDKTYYANWIANGNTAYKVLHYKQGENGYQLAQTENLTAVTGATATAVPKIYEGYIENTSHEERVVSGTVVADGSLELKLYYDILKYEVIFKDGENVLDTQTIAYGGAAIAPVLTKEGYVLRWDKEYSDVKSNLTINAIWLRDTDKDGIPDIEDTETLVEYIVKHYKQQGETNTYELAEEEKLQGQLGSIVNAIPKTYVGYAENTTAEERRPSGTITSDEKLELILLYYRLKYTVTFKDGDEIISAIEVQHGETVTPPTLTKPGYTLSWDKALDNITEEQTITAIWTKIPEKQREYKVEHYVETKDGGYVLKETERQIGNIGDIVIGKEKVYEEYMLDETNESTVKTGKIEENQELVLKLYYKYKRFTIIFKDEEKEVGRQEVIYGGTAKPPILTKPGYILSWDKSLDKITGEQTIIAVWTKDPNYKDPNQGKEERPSILPQTGEETVTLGAIMVLLGISVISFIKYKF